MGQFSQPRRAPASRGLLFLAGSFAPASGCWLHMVSENLAQYQPSPFLLEGAGRYKWHTIPDKTLLSQPHGIIRSQVCHSTLTNQGINLAVVKAGMVAPCIAGPASHCCAHAHEGPEAHACHGSSYAVPDIILFFLLHVTVPCLEIQGKDGVTQQPGVYNRR